MKNNVSTTSSFSRCYRSADTDCTALPVITLVYKDRSDHSAIIDVSVNSTTKTKYDISLYQYYGLGTASVSATRNQSFTGVYTAADVKVSSKDNFTICATAVSDKQLTQCQFVTLPYYQASSHSYTIRALPLATTVLFAFLANIMI